MRNKELFQEKFQRLERTVKLVGYHIHRDERKEGYDLIENVLKQIGDMQTLLRTETQD